MAKPCAIIQISQWKEAIEGRRTCASLRHALFWRLFGLQNDNNEWYLIWSNARQEKLIIGLKTSVNIGREWLQSVWTTPLLYNLFDINMA